MLRIIAFTGGHNAPSRIFRVRHYVQPLKTLGVDLCECPSRAGLYPPDSQWRRPWWGIRNLCERVPDVIGSHRYHLSFFQRELVSTLTTVEWLAKRPRILDVDDAIWVHPRGSFARRLAKLCDHVICGNRFLAEEFSQWNPSVSVLPTSVDVHAFAPWATKPREERPIIGWMGLSTGLTYLYGIERSLARVLQAHPRAVLRIVSGHPPTFRQLPPHQVEYIPWTEKDEARTIQEMTIGIMPLDNSVHARGKCSLKMLLYMACGLPVVVTPIGMNADVLAAGPIGFGATTGDEWVDHLTELLLDPDRAAEMGRNGREVVVNQYSVEALVPKLAATLLHVGGQTA